MTNKSVDNVVRIVFDSQRNAIQQSLDKELDNPLGIYVSKDYGRLRDVRNEVERQYLLGVLRHTGGNVSRTAYIAGTDRRTIERKIADLGLEDSLNKIRSELPNFKMDVRRRIEQNLRDAMTAYTMLGRLPDYAQKNITEEQIPKAASELAEKVLSNLPTIKDAVSTVEQRVVNALVDSIGIKKAAEYLGISERTIRRKSGAEGKSHAMPENEPKMYQRIGECYKRAA